MARMEHYGFLPIKELIVEYQHTENRSYDIFDGLQDYEFMELSAGVMTNGTMIFGGVNGLTLQT